MKKQFRLFLTVLVAGLSMQHAMMAQGGLPVVQATGGEGTNVDYPALKKAREAEEGTGMFHHDFSVCSQEVKAVNASSTLAAQGSKNYKLQNACDYDPMTAWVEGVKGYGVGEWFEVKAEMLNAIYNGYQRSPAAWKSNSRVKRLKVYVDGELLCYLVLKDEMGEQRFELPMEPAWGTFKTFRFEIQDVYKGSKWDDVAITYVGYYGCCFGMGTMIATAQGDRPIDDLGEQNKVMGVDLDAGSTYETTVKSKAGRQHPELLELRVPNGAVRLTPEHPLYVKRMGFISMAELKAARNSESWETLQDSKVEVGIWNHKTNQLEFATLSSIRLLKGPFETQTLSKLSRGETFIANGFVTKVY